MNTTVFQAVERFANVLQAQPDTALERPWAWQAYDSEGVRFACFRTYEETRELAARLMAERIAHATPPTTAQHILAQYHAAFRDLQALVLGTGAGQLDQPPAANEWPLRTVLQHIIGADAGFMVGVTFALDRGRRDESVVSIPDSAWDEIIGMSEEQFGALMDGPLTDIFEHYEALHRRIVEDFKGISESELDIPSYYWEGYELPLRFRLHRFESHLRQHTIQVAKTLESIGRPMTEIRQLLRLLYAGLAEGEGMTIGAEQLGIEHQTRVADSIIARADEIAAALH
jgi:hypothetical protein